MTLRQIDQWMTDLPLWMFLTLTCYLPAAILIAVGLLVTA